MNMTGKMPLSRAMLAAVNREIADRATAGKRITAAELSKATGIPDKTLRRRLDADVRMDPDTFEVVAVALGFTADQMWAKARLIQDTEQWDEAKLRLPAKLPPPEHFTAQIQDPEARAAIEAEVEKATKRRRADGSNGQ